MHVCILYRISRDPYLLSHNCPIELFVYSVFDFANQLFTKSRSLYKKRWQKPLWSNIQTRMITTSKFQVVVTREWVRKEKKNEFNLNVCIQSMIRLLFELKEKRKKKRRYFNIHKIRFIIKFYSFFIFLLLVWCQQFV